MSQKKNKDQPVESGGQTALDLESLNLESALKRLEEIVALMDSDSLELEKTIQLFQEGMQLTRFCREQIAQAEQQISKLVEESEGDLTLEDFGDA